MSPEAQRIAIAEACGWRFFEWNPPVSRETKEAAILCWVRPGNDEWQQEKLPNYLNDLNAMHEAEKVLTPDYQTVLYLDNLGWVCRRDGPEVPWLECPFATATQRAEAFLRTIGKWEGGPQ